jgi:hypothetical protein
MVTGKLPGPAYRKEQAMDQSHSDLVPRKALIAVMVSLAATHSAVRAEMRSTKVCSPAMAQAHLTATVLPALVVKSVLVEAFARVKTPALVSVPQVATWAAALAYHTRRPMQTSAPVELVKD